MRKKNQKVNSRSRTEVEIKSAISTSIDELLLLCHIYDKGNFSVARLISVTLCRLLFDELPKLSGYSKILIPSIATDPDLSNGFDEMPLISYEISVVIELDRPFSAVFKPVDPEIDTTNILLPYGKWLKQHVFVEGKLRLARRINTKIDLIPDTHPRRRASREEVIKRLRNEVGAHFDPDISRDMDFLTEHNLPLVLAMSDGKGGSWNQIDHPEKYVFPNSPADAMIRQIAGELLASPGRSQEWRQDRLAQLLADPSPASNTFTINNSKFHPT